MTILSSLIKVIKRNGLYDVYYRDAIEKYCFLTDIYSKAPAHKRTSLIFM